MNVRKLIILQLLACLSMTCLAQNTETKYYKNGSMAEEVSQEKAKYSRTIAKNSDGSITTETKNLKKNLIESRYILKGDEPVGNWIYLTGRGPVEIDYDFSLEYSDHNCTKNINIKDYFSDEINIGYEAPKINTGENFYEFVAMNVFYPPKAKSQDIQGTVELIFDLTKNGTIENIRVRKGVHVDLDKEAVRVLRKIKLSNPPKINGQSLDICGSVSISFRLA